MSSVAIYLRLSIEDRDKRYKSDESESIQNQKSMLREYCSERNWEIYDIYCDEDYSGVDKERPEFKRMLKDCEDRKVNIVLCKSQSRFSRDIEIIERYIHNKFIEWGIRFVSIVDHADSDDVSNKKARQINGLINEWYLEDVSDNIRKTLKHKRQLGEFTGSFAPYGYLVDPDNKNHLVIDKNTAPIVSDIFNWYVSGWGYRKIVMELNNRNVPCPTLYKQQINSNYVNKNQSNSSSAGLWTHSTIYKMIRNEVYIGSLVQGKSHNVSYKNKKRKAVPQEEWIRIADCHKSIIEMDTWKKIQKRLKSKTRVSQTQYELSPLAGKVKCAVCGRPMKRNVYYNKQKTKAYYSLQCSTYKSGAMNCSNTSTISGMQLEKAILEEINSLISRYCQIDKIEIIDTQYEKIQSYRAMLKSYEEQVEKNKKKLVHLYEDKLDGIITKEQYVILSDKYNDEQMLLHEKLKSIEGQLVDIEKNQNNIIHKREFPRKYLHLEKLTRNIVEEFVEQIYVGMVQDDMVREVRVEWRV